MKIAVVGCAHGELDAIYEAIEEIERSQSFKVDLVICPGDFQAVRNLGDLRCMNCPDKYKDMRSFWKYYAGVAKAKIPTLFVGGNHEASNHLQEVPLGGLVAPNVYYLGNAGVVNFRGLRIAGVSGIYVDHNYNRKRMERPPYQPYDMKSVCHARKEDMDRLLRIERPVDVFISHDWPRGITDFGDLEKLLRAKPFFKADIAKGALGNPGAMQVLKKVQPKYWFAAHMHVKFPAIVTHEDSGKRTKFLALDKIIAQRDFVQVLDVPANENEMVEGEQSAEQCVHLDAEWLSILHTEANEPGRTDGVSDEEMNKTMSLLKEKGVRMDVRLESDFQRRATVHGQRSPDGQPIETFCIQPRNVELFAALQLSAPPDYVLLRYPPAESDKGKVEGDTDGKQDEASQRSDTTMIG